MTLSRTIGRLGAGLLRTLDPEQAHGVAIRALKAGVVPGCRVSPDPRLAVRVAGLDFPNPLGMAAGFDKNAEVPDAVLALGFGFVEVGTVTPRPQAGNPRPRIFRLPGDGAVVNRLGFNNEGHDAAYARLAARAGRAGIVGVNIGANKDSSDRTGDYVAGVRRFASVASYLTVNISSPNTPGLRDLQARDALDELLARTIDTRDALPGRRVPVFLKIAPDVAEEGIDDIAAVALARGVDGLIVSNTTLSRAGLTDPAAKETGGLSGRPMFRRSTIALAKMRQRVGPQMPLIGVGGIASARDVLAKVKAGADLVQLYTAFIYAGSGLAADILDELGRLVRADGAADLRALRDRDVADLARLPLAD